MPQNDEMNLRKEHLTKIILTLIFLGGFGVFTGWMMLFGPGLALFDLSAMQFTLLAFSTYRLGRLIAYDRVMEPFRKFFTVTMPDSTGAGDTVDAKGVGIQQALGQLICCPICAGTWMAALLTYALYLFPGPATVFLTMTAAIGVAELLGALTEALSWSGQHARTQVGLKNLEREQILSERQGHPVEFPERKQGNPVDTPESYREYR